MDSKILAISAVAIILVAAIVGAVVVVSDDDDDNNNASDDNNKTVKKDFTYSKDKGWYSWNPTMFKVSSSKISLSPLMLDQVETMFTNIYGSAPDYTKYNYTIDQVPDDFLSYDSLVISSTDTTITVASNIRISSSYGTWATVPVTIEKQPDHLISAGSIVAILYTLLQEKMSAADAEAQIWNWVYALDRSAFPGGSGDLSEYGLTVPDSVTKLTSTYYLMRNIETYTDLVDKGTTQEGESVLIFLAGSLSDGYAGLSSFYSMLDAASPGDAQLIGYSTANLSNILATIDMVGQIYGLEDQAQSYLDNMRCKLYAMSQEAKDLDKGYTFYLESTSGSGAGVDTIVSHICTQILGMKNICTHSQWQKIGDEKVVEYAPDVIMFYESDKRDTNTQMRVGVEISV